MDEATRRQVRFSLFLQIAAAAMLAVAFGVQVSASGWGVATLLLGVGAVVFAGIALFTWSKLRGTAG